MTCAVRGSTLGCLTLAGFLVGCSDDAQPNVATGSDQAANTVASQQEPVHEASEPVIVSLGTSGGSVALSGEGITENSDGTVRWNVPGEGHFAVSVPYKGDVPRRVMMQLVWLTAGRDPAPELGSISATPALDGDTLTYSVSLPVYSVVNGRQKCRIRTMNLAGSEPSLIYEGDLEIEFSKVPRKN